MRCDHGYTTCEGRALGPPLSLPATLPPGVPDAIGCEPTAPGAAGAPVKGGAPAEEGGRPALAAAAEVMLFMAYAPGPVSPLLRGGLLGSCRAAGDIPAPGPPGGPPKVYPPAAPGGPFSELGDPKSPCCGTATGVTDGAPGVPLEMDDLLPP